MQRDRLSLEAGSDDVFADSSAAVGGTYSPNFASAALFSETQNAGTSETFEGIQVRSYATVKARGMRLSCCSKSIAFGRGVDSISPDRDVCLSKTRTRLNLQVVVGEVFPLESRFQAQASYVNTGEQGCRDAKSAYSHARVIREWSILANLLVVG